MFFQTNYVSPKDIYGHIFRYAWQAKNLGLFLKKNGIYFGNSSPNYNFCEKLENLGLRILIR